MKNLAMGLLLLSACGANTQSGTERGVPADTDVAGTAGAVSLEAGAASVAGVQAGAGGATGGFVPAPPAAGASGVGAAGAATVAMGGDAPASEAGAGPLGPRCDYIKECKEVPQPCAAATNAKCGAGMLGTFACGSVSGFYSSDGASFPCVQGTTGLDCSTASAASIQHCSSSDGTGGSGGSAGSGGTPLAQCSLDSNANDGCQDWQAGTTPRGIYNVRNCSCSATNSCAGSIVHLSSPAVGSGINVFKCASCTDCAAANQAASNFEYGN